MKNLKINNGEKKKGLRTSFMVHGIILALALLPFLKENVNTAEEATMMEIAFVYDEISSGSASTAPKEVTTPEPLEEKPVTKKNIETPPVESAPILTEATAEEVVVEEVPENEVEEVVLKEVTEDNTPESEVVETVEDKNLENGDSKSEKGEGEQGERMTGKKLGAMDFDGEGVFGRKVVYRADVKKITEKEGIVVINLCINREGLVTHVAFNRDNSTIDDSEYVKRAMDVASNYKFEKDYSAPDTQCGKLSFIFEIE